MTRNGCTRLWQVEAARDGRLAGDELSNALRHRAECADCNQEARALSALGIQIKEFPVAPADPLVRRRTRQALLSAWNEQLLGERSPKARPRLALIAGCCVAAVALAVGYPALRSRTAPAAPFFQVVAKPGTLWTAREMSKTTRITLQAGLASFTVRRRSGQRLYVDLPDGEIEDLGTVFEVEVQAQRTVRVSVSEGRVLVRLKAQPGFELGAGQSWQPEPGPLPGAPSQMLAAEPALAKPPTNSPPAKAPATPRREPAATLRTPDDAEDETYLHIVDLLRNGHEREARAKASQYLAQFPNGFRRLEVANIAER